MNSQLSGNFNEHDERYFTIGEAADILGVSVPTIRLYERSGLIIPYRRRSKHRRFSQTDIERVRCMRHMINTEKVSIAGIARLLSLIPCWKVKDCPDDAREACPAFHQSESPCWMVTNKSWDCKSAECRHCEVYNNIADCHDLKSTIARFTIDALPEQPVVSSVL